MSLLKVLFKSILLCFFIDFFGESILLIAFSRLFDSLGSFTSSWDFTFINFISFLCLEDFIFYGLAIILSSSFEAFFLNFCYSLGGEASYSLDCSFASIVLQIFSRIRLSFELFRLSALLSKEQLFLNFLMEVFCSEYWLRSPAPFRRVARLAIFCLSYCIFLDSLMVFLEAEFSVSFGALGKSVS